MAERLFIGRRTLWRLEKGDPTVSLGAFASAAFVLHLHERLAQLAAPAQDTLAFELGEERLPKRIRRKKAYWAPSLHPGGTPGTANSQAVTNLPPLLLDARHQPLDPAAFEAFATIRGPHQPEPVTFRAPDPDQSLRFYRVRIRNR